MDDLRRNFVTLVKTRAKALADRGVCNVRCLVGEDGSVRVWDSMAGHYTSCHALREPAIRRIQRLAGWYRA